MKTSEKDGVLYRIFAFPGRGKARHDFSTIVTYALPSALELSKLLKKAGYRVEMEERRTSTTIESRPIILEKRK